MIRDDRGFTVVGIMVMSLSLLIVVSGILVYGSATNKRAASEEQRAKAFYAAESGINHAMALLRADVELPYSEAPTEGIIPAGAPAVTSPAGTKPEYQVWLYLDENGQLKIVSQGEEGTALRNVAVQVTDGTPPTMGDEEVVAISWPTCGCSINTASQGTMEVNSNQSKTITASGVYDNINVNSNGKLEVLTSSETKVKGSTNLNSNTSMIVRGNGSYSLCSNYLGLNSNGSLTINNSAPTAICTNSLAINSNAYINFNVNGAVTLCTSPSSGSFNSNGAIKLASGTNFIFWANGSLEINSNFATDDSGSSSQANSSWPRIVVKQGLNLNSNARLGDAGRRPVLIFMDPAYENDVVLNSNAKVYGAIWAPTRRVILNGNAKVYGKVIAKEIIDRKSGYDPDYYPEDKFNGITIPGAEYGGAGMGIGEYQDR